MAFAAHITTTETAITYIIPNVQPHEAPHLREWTNQIRGLAVTKLTEFASDNASFPLPTGLVFHSGASVCANIGWTMQFCGRACLKLHPTKNAEPYAFCQAIYLTCLALCGERLSEDKASLLALYGGASERVGNALRTLISSPAVAGMECFAQLRMICDVLAMKHVTTAEFGTKADVRGAFAAIGAPAASVPVQVIMQAPVPAPVAASCPICAGGHGHIAHSCTTKATGVPKCPICLAGHRGIPHACIDQ